MADSSASSGIKGVNAVTSARRGSFSSSSVTFTKGYAAFSDEDVKRGSPAISFEKYPSARS